MLGIHELWLFVLSGILLNITPGPDTAYIIGRSIQFGWRGGAAAAIGISCGCVVHVLAATIGLSALLMASSTAFAVLKLCGAAYLLFTGVRILNPKVALFFLAFLPQFVDAASPHQALAFLVLGAIFICTGTLWCLAIAAFAARAASRIRQSRRAIGWINRALGGLFVYLGIRVAMLEAR